MYRQLAISLLIASATAALAQTTVSYVYVGENTSPQKIAAFAIRSDNSVHTVSGSPFTAPSFALAASTNFLFATNLTNIAAYKRNSSGSLTLLSSFNGVRNLDSEVGSLTLDRTATSLYASEDDGLGDNDFDIYDKLSSGKLSYVTSTQISAVYGGPLQFNTANKYAYQISCIMADFDIPAFTRESDGVLTPLNATFDLPPHSGPEDLCPSGIATSALGFAAISYFAIGPSGFQNIAVYRIAGDGSLHFVSQISTNSANANQSRFSLQFDRTGAFLAAAGQKGVQLYKLSSTGILSKIGSPLYSGTTFRALKWDKTNHIYAISGAAVYFFTVKSGKLVQAASPRLVPSASSLAVVSLQ
jgi:6-phosphogluconolactonase (cycloisomerase 2 family)